MKKIGIVVPWFGMDIPGGSEAEIRGLAFHLVRANIKLEILTTCAKEFCSDWGKNYHKPGITTENGIIVRRFEVDTRDAEKFDAINLRLMDYKIPLSEEDEKIFAEEMINSTRLYHYLECNQDEYSIFIFIPYLFGTTYYGLRVCPQKSVLIPCLHDEGYIYLNIFKDAFCKIAGMIFHSRPEYELAEKVYDLKDVNTQILGEGINTELQYNAGRFCEKYKIFDPYILYAGRKDKGKNVHTLLKYFKEYKHRNCTSLKLVLIGGGDIDISEDIKNEVYDLGYLSDQDKYDAYGASTILCQPSLNESFSIVIMESWLCSRPVLVNAKCETTKYFAQSSNGGLYFSDYFEFEEIINFIQKHPKAADIMGRQGRDYVCKNFAWNIIVDKYIRFFNEIVSQ